MVEVTSKLISFSAIPNTAKLTRMEMPYAPNDASITMCYWYELPDGTIIKAHVYMDVSYEVNDKPTGTVHGQFPPHTLKRDDDSMTVTFNTSQDGNAND